MQKSVASTKVVNQIKPQKLKFDSNKEKQIPVAVKSNLVPNWEQNAVSKKVSKFLKKHFMKIV